MKILIATGIYPPSIGGPATYSKLLFSELPKRGIDVSVVSFDEVRRFPKIFRHVIYFFKVLFRSRGNDIVYVQDPVSVGFPALVASKISGKKTILKLVGDYAWEQGVQRFGVTDSLDVFCQKRSGYGFRVRVLKWIQKFVAKHVNKIIVPSEYLKGVVTAWGVNPSKISVIYNAFNVPKGISHTNFSKLNNLFSKKIILSVGRLVPWKGFETLILLMPEILKKISDVSLVIVGDGPDYEKLSFLIKEKKLEDTVNLIGRLEHETLLLYIKASTIFVLNTGYEGFSHQLLEVMASGTPIITTSVGGNKEIITHGENGILVGYDNKEELLSNIIRLLNHSSNREKLIKAGLQRVDDFNTEKMFSKLIETLTF